MMQIRQTAAEKQEKIRQGIVMQKALVTQNLEMDKVLRKADQKSEARNRNLDSEKEIKEKKMREAKEVRDRKCAELEEGRKLAKVMAESKRQEIVRIKTKQLNQNNSYEHRCTERQSEAARVREELLKQIKEKEALKREKNAREYGGQMKMIVPWGDEKMDYKTIGNSSRPQKNELKSNSLRAEREEFMKTRNEFKEKDMEKLRDADKLLMENFQKLDVDKEKKETENRQKKIQYGIDLKTMIEHNTDIKKRVKLEDQRSADIGREPKQHEQNSGMFFPPNSRARVVNPIWGTHIF